ncbi:MAG: hypothetical protein KF744_11035 [Taibaiella sp.]|nr:hypothetical protein [Taibaiella sp.]
MNSTDLLDDLRELTVDENGDLHEMNIIALASVLGVTVPSLVSMLADLERRNEIVANISPKYRPDTGVVDYNGTVKLITVPPDDRFSSGI